MSTSKPTKKKIRESFQQPERKVRQNRELTGTHHHTFLRWSEDNLNNPREILGASGQGRYNL